MHTHGLPACLVLLQHMRNICAGTSVSSTHRAQLPCCNPCAGMVARNGQQFASRIALGCSDGSVVADPVTSYAGVVRNATGAVVRPRCPGCH